MESVPIQMPDGTTVTVRLIPAKGPHRHPITPDTPRPVVVIAPGLGVPGEYYSLFGIPLAARGFDVALLEMRGNGDSREANRRAPGGYGYQELVAVDFPAMFQVVRERFPDSTPYLLGHSMGGQLGLMYASRIRGRLAGLILVASGTPHHRGYGGLTGPGFLLGSAAISLTANLAGFWPGDTVVAGSFGRQSRLLIEDWARVARTGRFEPTGADIDYEERISRLKLPVLSITMTGDDLTPVRAAKLLLQKLPNAEVSTWHNPAPHGHNGWISDPGNTVDYVEKWLRDR
ncbi:alpha/beta fold hydrolase [Nocardia sp. NPDC056100]|uniref:alpha/beta hydrolase family protein n=1 Tax=Nocardia sp. NPDC056100 TaxID=3345712 RepID=UPI0035D77440